MNLIAHESHFWELYQDFEHYYLSIAVDMSSEVRNWQFKESDIGGINYLL